MGEDEKNKNPLNQVNDKVFPQVTVPRDKE